jgi:F-type H+-transporting ATPase subunit epsilon
MAEFRCIVVTPEQTSLDHPVSFVVLPLTDGEIGIGPGHSPLIGRLGYGEMRLTRNGSVDRYYIDGGFVQVADNVVSVLTGRLVPAGNLDAAAARDQLEDALRRPAHTDALLEIRERLVAQARAQLHVIRRRG